MKFVFQGWPAPRAGLSSRTRSSWPTGFRARDPVFPLLSKQSRHTFPTTTTTTATAVSTTPD